MSTIGLCLTLSVGLAIGLLFAIDPSLDLNVAKYFHQFNVSGWPAGVETALSAIRNFNLYLVVGLLVFCIVVLVLQLQRARTGLPDLRACVLILLVIATGPGLTVNAIFKENWSRPRPGVVLASGDESTFRAWWDPRGTCSRNCSFASGEASAAYALLAVAVVTPLAFRYTAITLALIYGSLIGATRIAVGGHFVSDVVFAGVISALAVWVLHGAIYRWPATRVGEAEMRARLSALALGIRRRAAASIAAVRRMASAKGSRKRLKDAHGEASARTSPASS
ncbi:phosphatase PAP2 family protein [Pseudorhodoplanes sp.]|uniref:phosphatase PAP2 family protein n=1 Tax=Pseudorhodoplanes sp. TaxID=1934341 RepID=UPI00391DD76B